MNTTARCIPRWGRKAIRLVEVHPDAQKRSCGMSCSTRTSMSSPRVGRAIGRSACPHCTPTGASLGRLTRPYRLLFEPARCCTMKSRETSSASARTGSSVVDSLSSAVSDGVSSSSVASVPIRVWILSAGLHLGFRSSISAFLAARFRLTGSSSSRLRSSDRSSTM